jgi:aquaporin related protein
MNIQRLKKRTSEPGPVKSYFRRVFAILPPSARGHVVAFIGEFVGTISFLTFAFAGGSSGAAAANSWADGDKFNTKAFVSSPELLLAVAFSAGLSLVVNAWIFFRISGGLFNPAVCVSLMLP